MFLLFLFLETYLSLELDRDTFEITTCVHPSTYLNKILLGSKQGTLQLWNIRTKYVSLRYRTSIKTEHIDFFNNIP